MMIDYSSAAYYAELIRPMRAKTLEDQIYKSGGSIQIFDPVTKAFTQWVRK
jgi:hypothetical protein